MDIIEQLRDDEQYYKGVGKEFLSNSDIGTLLNNPQDYGKYREDNKTFAEGRYFHQLILEPEKVKDVPMVDVSTRTTKEYKSFCENNNLPFCLLKKEVEEMERLVAIMKGNITFFEEIYRDGNQYEVPNVGEIQGMMWKGKADIVTDTMVIDLKTTSDINKFKYSAKAYNYDSQCYIYQMLFGKPLVFYVVDKLTGQLGVFKPTDEFVGGGAIKVGKAIEVFNKYFSKTPSDDIANYFIEENL
jgi:peroxiredoxin